MSKLTNGYEITKADIDSAIRYLIFVEKVKNPTREEAINLLEKKYTLVHLAAHKIVDDEQSGKIKKVKTK
jgi:Mg2+ and Co2+ transporter CorA